MFFLYLERHRKRPEGAYLSTIYQQAAFESPLSIKLFLDVGALGRVFAQVLYIYIYLLLVMIFIKRIRRFVFATASLPGRKTISFSFSTNSKTTSKSSKTSTLEKTAHYAGIVEWLLKRQLP